MTPTFIYFQGPIEDMAHLVEGERDCSLCKHTSPCFELDFAICREMGEDEKMGKIGCIACLRQGGFEFWHDTDVGVLDENGFAKVYHHNKTPPPNFPETAQIEFRRTPRIVTWQQELWRAHCNDFMIYQGT